MNTPQNKLLESEITICVITGGASIPLLAFLDQPKYIFVVSLFFTCFVALLLKLVSGQHDRSFKDFFIGENNTYSLSRIQFFLWVLIIISCQISVIIILIKIDSLGMYNFILGPNVLWILAASFGTYLTVQGIANKKKEENKLLVKQPASRAFSDILKDGDKLDFTKFQMAIWTLIAIGVYYFHNVTYVNGINDIIRKSATESKLLMASDSFSTAVKHHITQIEILKTYSNKDVQEKSKKEADTVLYLNGVIESKLRVADSLYLKHDIIETLIFELHVINDSIRSNHPKITTQPVKKTEYGQWYVYESAFLKKLDALMTEMVRQRQGLLATTNSKARIYFNDAPDGEASPVPDISVTFLILMGLVQGTYVGKKLLPSEPLEGTTGSSGVPGANFIPVSSGSAKEFEELKLKDALALAEIKYLDKSFVTGVDIGLKEVGKNTTDQKVIRIHVRKKVLPQELSVDERIPLMLNGVATDVIESNFTIQNSTTPAAPNTRKGKCNPLQPGISIGDGVNTGTLGLMVTKKTPPNAACVISNFHVLKSDVAIQPGSGDGGQLATDEIGKKIQSLLDQRGDASLIQLTPGSRQIDKTIFGTTHILVGHGLPVVKQTLSKSGKESGITSGSVVAEVGKYKVPGTAFVVKGFLIAPSGGTTISVKGDSGSCWYDEKTLLGIGLHIGIDENGNAIACLLDEVLNAFDVTL